jgi:hypothetical protein
MRTLGSESASGGRAEVMDIESVRALRFLLVISSLLFAGTVLRRTVSR